MSAPPVAEECSDFDPEGGFTISWRRKWNNPIFKKKLEVAVWDWMCDTAQWEASRIPTKFGRVELNRGEVIIAERVLAEEFGMHRNTLRSLLQRLVDDGMITMIRDRIPHRAGTVVHITKYEEYQSFANVRKYLEDRKKRNFRTEVGPKEDRSGTKNNESNTVKKEDSYVAPSAQIPSVVGSADLCVNRADTVLTIANETPTLIPLPPVQAPVKSKPKGAAKQILFEPWMKEPWKRFMDAYPSRGAVNPQVAGREAFARLLLKGINPEELIAGATAYMSEATRTGSLGTRGVMHYARFLNPLEEFWSQFIEEERKQTASNVHPLRPNNRYHYDHQVRLPRHAGEVG